MADELLSNLIPGHRGLKDAPIEGLLPADMRQAQYRRAQVSAASPWQREFLEPTGQERYAAPFPTQGELVRALMQPEAKPAEVSLLDDY